MTANKKKGTETGGRPSWPVAAIYEDAETRKAATEFCDALARRYWSEYDFDLSWWTLAQLKEKAFDTEITAKAAAANVIIFALRPQGDLSVELKSWIEAWLSRRGEREGVLVGLNDPGAGLSGTMSDKFVFLRNAAHRYGMDYLTEVPQNMARSFPDSFESYTKRAESISSVLEEILHRQLPPPLLP